MRTARVPLAVLLLGCWAYPSAAPAGTKADQKSLGTYVNALQSGGTENKVQAASELRNLGRKAGETSRLICEVAVKEPGKVRDACLYALENVCPEIAGPVHTLLTLEKGPTHTHALHKLTELRQNAGPAVPVLAWELREGYKVTVQAGHEGRYLGGDSVVVGALLAIGKIAPHDQEAVEATAACLLTGREEDDRAKHTPPIRWTAADQLGDVATCKEDAVRKKAVSALYLYITGPVPKEAAEHLAWLHAVDALARFGPEASAATSAIRNGLKQENAAGREACRRALAKIEKK